MIRVRDNITRRLKKMHPHAPYPHPNLPKNPDRRYNTCRFKLKPEEKLRAIQRIRNGESKAGVAREINVPESTIRGWFKNADKLESIVNPKWFTKRKHADEKHTPKLKKSLNKLDKPTHGIVPSNGLPPPVIIDLTQSTSDPKSGIALNLPEHYRPWITNQSAAHYYSNQFGSNVQYGPDPRNLPSSSSHSHSPISTNSQMNSQETGEKQSLIMPQHAKNHKSVTKTMQGNSPTPRASSNVFNFRLPADLSIRPNPAARPVGTMSDNLNRNSDNSNIGNNNTTAPNKETGDSTIDPLEALRCALNFYNWFQTYSDPTLTAQDFLKFEELLAKVKAITLRGQSSASESAEQVE